MPYKLIYISNEDKKTEIKPLSCDNPNSEFGFEDNSIERKGRALAKKIEKFDDVKKCYNEHY